MHLIASLIRCVGGSGSTPDCPTERRHSGDDAPARRAGPGRSGAGACAA